MGKVLGIILVFNVAIWCLTAVLAALQQAPWWWAVWLCAGCIWTGCMAVTSIVRDRL
jgi:hypothetical protein